MNYPKMLYKGKAIYMDSAQIKDDLASRKIETFIVTTEDDEAWRRAQGWVDLADLIAQRPVLKLPTHTSESKPEPMVAAKVKRKYTRRATSDNAA